MSCKRVTELISLARDRRLTMRERLSLLLHVLFCSPCRSFRAQLRILAAIVGRGDGDSIEAALSPEARARIGAALARPTTD